MSEDFPATVDIAEGKVKKGVDEEERGREQGRDGGSEQGREEGREEGSAAGVIAMNGRDGLHTPPTPPTPPPRPPRSQPTHNSKSKREMMELQVGTDIVVIS